MFSYCTDGKWNRINKVLDQSVLSDEASNSGGGGWFTGAFIGLCCHDLIGTGIYADFDYFEYKEYDVK